MKPAYTVAISTLLLSGCGNSDSGFTAEDFEPQFADLQFVNLMADSFSITVQVDESDDIDGTFAVDSQLGFRDSTALQSLVVPVDYEYSVFFVDDENETTYIVDEVSLELIDDDQIVFLYTGSLGSPTEHIVRFIDPEIGTEIGDDQVEVWFANTASFDEDVELYLTSPTTSIEQTFPIAVLSPGEQSTAVIINERDEYRLRATAALSGELLFDSTEFNLAGATRNLFAIVDHFGPIDDQYESGAQLDVRLVNPSGSVSLIDDEAQSEARIVNLVPNEVIDTYAGSTSGDPLFANVSHQDVTPYVRIDSGEFNLNITPQGVKDEFIFERTLTISPGTFNTFIFTARENDDDDEDEPDLQYDITSNTLESRAIFNQVVVSVVNSGQINSQLDFYLLSAGQPIDDVEPLGTLLTGQLNGFVAEPGVYDVAITAAGDSTIIFGPDRLELVQGIAYSLIVVEEVLSEATSTSLILLED